MKKRNNKINILGKISATILSTIVIFSLVALNTTVIGQASIENDTRTEDMVVTTYSNNLSLPENTEIENSDFIIDNVKAIIDKYSINNDIAISFTDFTTNEYIGFNDNREFLGASTTKLPLALFICDKLEKGEISLTDTIEYSSTDYEDGAGVMFDSYEGQLYTIETLLQNMLVHSDNIATNMIYRHFGYSETKQAMGDLVGIQIITTENIITSQQMNEFIKFLYNNRNKAYYKDVISLLSKTDFHDRLDKYLPYNVVSHKIGNYNGNTHDVGIVFLDRPYSLSVYTDNIEEAEELIAGLSKEIYDLYSTH